MVGAEVAEIFASGRIEPSAVSKIFCDEVSYLIGYIAQHYVLEKEYAHGHWNHWRLLES